MTIALAGGGGSGKTYTALVLATAMAKNGPVGLIDTEDGRGERYFRQFDYLYDKLEAPFNPGRYIDAMQSGVDAGLGALVVDSCSHEWEGEGGCLDKHLEITGGNEKKNAVAWAQVKPAHRKFIEFAKRAKIPTVFCFRAREKSKPVPGQGFVSIGWQPITNDETSFEFVLTAMLEPNGAGTMMSCKTFIDFQHIWKPGVQITPQIAQNLVAAHKKSCMPDEEIEPITVWLDPDRSEEMSTPVDALKLLGSSMKATDDLELRNAMLSNNIAWVQNFPDKQRTAIEELCLEMEEEDMFA